MQCRAYEKGFIRYIGPGPGEPRKGLWIFSLIFFILFGLFFVLSTIFSLVRNNNYVKFRMKYMLSGHSAAQEIKHLLKYTSGFIGPKILNFERSFSLSRGPKAVLFRLAKFLSEALQWELYITTNTMHSSMGWYPHNQRTFIAQRLYPQRRTVVILFLYSVLKLIV